MEFELRTIPTLQFFVTRFYQPNVFPKIAEKLGGKFLIAKDEGMHLME